MFNCDLVLNHESLLQIDTNYGGTPNWASVKKGITGVVPSPNEVVSQNQYVDGEGFAESHVTGGQFTIAVSGHRFINDVAQDFVMGLYLKLGCERNTQARFIDERGELKTGEVTIANIQPANGDPAAEGDISFEVHFNGKPTLIPATTAPELSAVVETGSVTGSTKFTATAESGNTLAYVITNAQPTCDINSLMFVRATGYVSDANIPVVADQYLNAFELDSDKRIVKYYGQVITSSDIA